ncbi:aminotransferase class IV [Spirosoma sp. SC4-14]|uniref:aminotransferase class IV n=1 Tax=Spirosoma sp. SC4-14 TaxID=3128900 RepID=UPI0030D5B8D0
MFLVYNSDILTEDEFQLPVGDRAFQYGDGLFETIRYENNHLWFWSDHMTRLTAGMLALGLSVPAGFNEPTIQHSILRLISANGLTPNPARIKLQVWRKPGGLYTPSSQDFNWLITAREGQPFRISKQTKIGIFDTYRLNESPVSAFKTLNALPYVLAGQHKQKHGFSDVALLNVGGYLAECVASNLFWFQNGLLYTPSLHTGCIDGIARRQLMRRFPDIQEGLFLPTILDEAEAVFAANVMGIQLFSGGWPDKRLDQIREIFIHKSV